MIRAMRKTILILFLVLLATTTLYSQGIRGEIQDRNGEPVPYAAIFIKELTRGTTCNALGRFSLPLPGGDYTIFFRSLGYTEVSRSIHVGESYTELTIQLPPQTYMIPEVRVSATGEDPAYWIMRKAIGLASYHLHEVSSYNAEIYIKGTAFIDKMPRAIARRIEVNAMEVKEDETYMLESLNEVKFKAPDKYEMNVIASQNTLPGYTDNVNPMDYINASLYQPQIETVVSPFARTAFSYYRFSFEGTFLEGTHIINKIKVTPKRKSQQLCEGYLYIVEDLWCLHSSELSVNTIAGTLILEQLYANVIMDAWLPVSHKIRALVDIAGVQGEATYVSSLKYSDVTLNPNLPETYFTPMTSKEVPDEPDDETVSKEQEKINELLEKEELTNRDVARLSKLIEKETEKGEQTDKDELNQTGTTFSVARDAVKNDSLFWNEKRPIPLTPEEHVTLRVRDSIRGIQAAAAPRDSSTTTLSVGRRGNPFRNIMFGRRWYAHQGRFFFTYGGLADIERLGYNTVDGIYYGQGLSFEWRPDTLFALRWRLDAGYAFHRKAPLIRWRSNLLYAPMARGKVALDMNYSSTDFNGSSGIPAPTNLVYTLLLRQNHLKLYEQIDATLYNRIDPVNGMILTTFVTFGLQNRLDNKNYFSLFYRNADEERFTANTPGSRPREVAELTDHKRLLAHLELSYTPRQYYIIRNNRKNLRGSDWPTFSAVYRKAFPMESTGWSEFSTLEGKISHSVEVGLLSQIDWNLSAGLFLDTASVHFADYRHFKTNPLHVDMSRLDNALMFTDYYETSTDRYWVSLQGSLTTSYLMVKYLPWFSERLWKESLHLAYLYTPDHRNYMQLGYSLNELFFLLDIGVYVGFGERGNAEQPEGWGYKGVTGRLNFRF